MEPDSNWTYLLAEPFLIQIKSQIIPGQPIERNVASLRSAPYFNFQPVNLEEPVNFRPGHYQDSKWVDHGTFNAATLRVIPSITDNTIALVQFKETPEETISATKIWSHKLPEKVRIDLSSFKVNSSHVAFLTEKEGARRWSWHQICVLACCEPVEFKCVLIECKETPPFALGNNGQIFVRKFDQVFKVNFDTENYRSGCR